MNNAPGGVNLSDQIIVACIQGDLAALQALIAALPLEAWPVSPAACVFTAVKGQQRDALRTLLEAGAPAHFQVQHLAVGDFDKLRSAGAAADGLPRTWTPLVMAVRAQSAPIAATLLKFGAPTAELAEGQPVLVHLAQVLAPSPPPPSAAAVWAALTGGGPGSPQPAAAAPVSTGELQELHGHLLLLLHLLRGGADPLQRGTEPPHFCFLDGEPACPSA
jgi:hypothetical protein